MPEAKVWYSPERDDDRFLPEGPRELVWQGRRAIIWVNIQTAADATTGTLLLRFWDTGEVVRFPMPGRPGFVVPLLRPGQLLVGMGQEVGLFQLDSQKWSPLARIPDENPRTIINDGEQILNSPYFVFGTKDTLFQDHIAGLYLFSFTPEMKITLLRDKQLCSNGKVFAESGADYYLYDIDTPSKIITRNKLDVEQGLLTLVNVAVDLREEADFPDGMIDGGNGTVIVAFYNPNKVGTGRAVRYSLETGQALQTWTVPGSPRVTCPLKISLPEGDKLLLTTATEGMPAEWRSTCPEAGSLFLADLN